MMTWEKRVKSPKLAQYWKMQLISVEIHKARNNLADHTATNWGSKYQMRIVRQKTHFSGFRHSR